MIVTLLIASLAVVLRIIRQAGWKERGELTPTMNELPKLITQHYEKNEGGSLALESHQDPERSRVGNR